MGVIWGMSVRHIIAAFAVVVFGALVWGIFDHTRDVRYTAVIQTAARDAIAASHVAPDMPARRVADILRRFVNDNSIHLIDEAFYAHWGDNESIFRKIVAHAEAARPPPHMECSSRAGIVEIMLRELGIRARSVVVYDPDKNFDSHTFLEFYNPATSRWEAQDPDYNVYWIDGKNGRRLGIRGMVALGAKRAVPCLEQGTCGWGVTSSEGLKVGTKKSYLTLASIRNNRTGERPLLVSAQVPEKRLEAFCETVAKDCRQEIIRLP